MSTLPPMSYVSLADFAATLGAPARAAPFAVDPSSTPPSLPGPLAARLDEIVDTVVALQQAEWLNDGAYVGPHAMPDLWRQVLQAARRLDTAAPVTVLAGVSASTMGAHGTDERPILLLSAPFVTTAEPDEVRFIIGRQIGQIAAAQVTARSLYALVVDHDGARRLARRAVGPALDVVLAPVALGLRVALSRWHRVAELTADRAGLLVCDDLDAARRALLRATLGGSPPMSVEAWLRQGRAARDPGPARWAEILADRPWLHKRLTALELWSRSRPFVDLGGSSSSSDLIDAAELARRTASLLAVGAA